ncbi:hypothetical protein LT336_00529 [Spiroplasma sp. JKS002671]|uniref:hypothetical protein n=1 Tax=Spiroplasma attinicola TaxID=2904537 RepID=UPI002022A987|nr:hypothetical protein [Spiroplasma sp. JKS002671]MCL8210785.1 hypothetical protein [Spiroplasma sp. JKS002671]
MKKKINSEILNNFINLIIIDVATKYLLKLKKEKNKPPKLIENYLTKAIYLLNKYETISISKMKNTIKDINEKEQKEFALLFTTYKEYEWLCKELNFAYLIMIDEDLQNKTLNLLYDNIYEIKFLFDNEKIITKEQIDINSVIKNSNTEKINELHYYKSSQSIGTNV